jgi:hypothetical protein
MQSEALKKQKNLRIWSQPKLPKEAVDQKSFAQWSLLVEDRTLYQALGRWSAVAGWQLIWDADRDFPVESNVHLTQTFLGAIEIVLETLKDTDYPLQAAVNTETRVVRIIRHLDQSN